jgi:hypothetical protein
MGDEREAQEQETDEVEKIKREWVLDAWSAIGGLYSVAEQIPTGLSMKVYDCCNRIQKVIPGLPVAEATAGRVSTKEDE